MNKSGKFYLSMILALLLGSCTAYRPYSQQQLQQQGRISTQVFYDELSPHGYWVHNRQYGYVWTPHVGRNFYPYATDGRWVMTDYGWTWLSDYEWGWAPFHYGRWDYDPTYGWFWFPGDEWAPAWVEWRMGDGYYGWAPIPPQSDFGMASREQFYDDDNRWIFVSDKDFGKPNIERYYVNPRRNSEIFGNTRIISNRRTDERRRVDYEAGPDPSDVERATGKRVERVVVRDSDTPGRRLRNNQLELYRPEIRNSPDTKPTPPKISDIKDVRPMRERNRNYQPDDIQMDETRDYPDRGQGTRDIDGERVQTRRQKEVRREYEEKQLDRQRRREEIELEQVKKYETRPPVQREQEQNRDDRLKRVEQQKRAMQKDRERTQAADTTRKIRREQSGNIRRR